MAKTENKKSDIEMQIKAIELLNSSLNLPADSGTPVTNFNFNINIESRADLTKKLLFIIAHVEIRGDEQPTILGALSVSCIFEMANFEEVIKVEADGKVNIPKYLVETLNGIAISTTRGIMFSTFKGTFLHGAVLPMIESKKFQATNQEVKK